MRCVVRSVGAVVVGFISAATVMMIVETLNRKPCATFKANNDP